MKNAANLITRVSLFLLCALLIAVPLLVQAENKVVVVPLSGDDLEPLANIVTVAKQNGDFSDVAAAINSISGASATNPYLVVVAPGTYSVGSGITLPSYVNLAGSGPEVTRLKGSTNGSTDLGVLLLLNSDVRVEGLTLENDNTENGLKRAVVIPQAAEDIVLKDVHILVENDNLFAPTIGVDNFSGSRVFVHDSRITILTQSETRAAIRSETAITTIFNSLLISDPIVLPGSTTPVCIGSVTEEFDGPVSVITPLNNDCEIPE